MKRESEKLVSSRNFSRLAPQNFVPANHKKSPIRKIKHPQHFRATRIMSTKFIVISIPIILPTLAISAFSRINEHRSLYPLNAGYKSGINGIIFQSFYLHLD